MTHPRSIVLEILEEIKTRVYDTPYDESILAWLDEKQKKLEDRVVLDFSRGVPPRYRSAIRQSLGQELADFLDGKSKIALNWKGRDRLAGVYKRLAVLMELYRFFEKEARRANLEIACLKQIQHELIESQISHIEELEKTENTTAHQDFLLSLVLSPFEKAIKEFITFLGAQQLEVFLFDDDKFLASELKTDGETFLYQSQSEQYEAPQSVSEITLKEVQATTLDVPLYVENEQIGHYRIHRQTTKDFAPQRWKEDVDRITPVLARCIESNRNRILSKKVYIDDLTGLYNKRKFTEQMGKLFKQFKTGAKSLYISMMDIDRFKTLNDTYGHPVGDRILKHTAEIIKSAVPYAYRYGGEEFTAVYYGHDERYTLDSLEKLRLEVSQSALKVDDEEYHVTISIGVARFETYMNSVMDAVDRADQALYASKEDGRNRTTFYDAIKGRLAADASRLRQEVINLREQLKAMSSLKEENKRLSAQIRKKKKPQE